MGRREQMVEKIKELMDKPEMIRNIGIVAHIDHGKTTLSDNLVAGAGLLSEQLAGKECVMDSYELEAERGITIFSANISLVFPHQNKEYLVNMIDTPGHVDFGGAVTRAMRAVDGIILVVCAVEGVMPQTERNLITALKEKVKPVLFINKVDRLINELQLDENQMQERLLKIINKVNELIRKHAPEEFKESWQVRVQDGSVAFGSAYNNWAISVPLMQETGIKFKDIYQYCRDGKQDELAKKIPGHKAVVDMIIKHIPNPKDAQKYRIPKIWKNGDLNSDIGKAMLSCDPNGKTVIMITSVDIDPHAGEIATGRVYSGKVRRGMKLHMINSKTVDTVQQVAFYMNTGRAQVDEIPAGNIAALSGLKSAFAGETAAEEEIAPFESIKHYSEPVMTKAVEAKNPRDLPKLIEVLHDIAKEDPTVKVEIDEETGEHRISGMGELHLEIIEHRISHDKGIPITTSPPIVVYRETVKSTGQQIEAKSPNKHNRFYIVVEPLEDEVYKAIIEGEIPEGKIKDSKTLAKKLAEYGMPLDQAKGIWEVKNGNVFLDNTKGVQYLNEAKELILQGFEEAMEKGPLANEKVTKVKVRLVDAVLHEDAVHRGPSQVIPAVKRGILAAILTADPILLEPKQKIFITVPQEYMGAVSTDIQGRRGQILDIEQDGELLTIITKVPVAETFGFAGEIRSATQGRAQWSTEYFGYEPLPRDLQQNVIKRIRERKGLKPEIPTPEELLS